MSYKPPVGIARIYNWGAVWDNDKVVWFWGKQVKSEGHDETRCDRKCTCLAKTKDDDSPS